MCFAQTLHDPAWVQAYATIATVVIAAITGGIVWWYTSITAKLHRVAREQIELGEKQLKQSQAHLEAEKAENVRLRKQEVLRNRPRIQWKSFIVNSSIEYRIRFINTGGEFAAISWVRDSIAHFSAVPERLILAGMEGEVELRDPQGLRCFPYRFYLSGTTNSNERLEFVFSIADSCSMPTLSEVKVLSS